MEEKMVLFSIAFITSILLSRNVVLVWTSDLSAVYRIPLHQMAISSLNLSSTVSKWKKRLPYTQQRPMEELTRASTTTNLPNIPFINSFNVLYSGAITVGTPPQTIYVNFDTTSADSWVPYAGIINLTSYNSVGPLPYSYNSSRSSTYQNKNGGSVNPTINISYPFQILPSSDFFGYDNSVAGYLAADTLNIAGLQLPNQKFVVAIKESILTVVFTLLSGVANGVIGLGYPSSSILNGTTPVFQNLIKNGLVAQPVFAFSFKNKYPNYFNASNYAVHVGDITIGGTDPSKYTGTLTWTSVTEKKFWQFNVKCLTVGSKCAKGTGLCPAGGCQMIIDTNSILIMGPRTKLDQMADQYGGIFNTTLGMYTVPCASVINGSLPTITFNIGGTAFSLPPQRYILFYDMAEYYCSPENITPPNTGLPSVFNPYDGLNDSKGRPLWVLGTAFVGNFYTAFDYGNNQIGFAYPVLA